jgi:hypothetical protein
MGSLTIQFLGILLAVDEVASNVLMYTGHFVVIPGGQIVEKLDLGKLDTYTDETFLCALRCLRTTKCNAVWMNRQGGKSVCEMFEVDRRFVQHGVRTIYTGSVTDYGRSPSFSFTCTTLSICSRAFDIADFCKDTQMYKSNALTNSFPLLLVNTST